MPTAQETTQREQFVAMLTRAYPAKTTGEVLAFASAIMRLGRGSYGYALAMCNREVTPAEEKRDDKRDERAEELCKDFGCGLLRGGDPRGYTYKLLVPEKDGNHRPYNTMGGAVCGWGVPGS